MTETINLTRTQKKCVTFKPKGDLLVKGIPGSGKSTIIMARAHYLKEKFPNDRILILTFNRALANYERQLSLKLHNAPLEASTFHNWGQKLLEQTDYPHTKLILGNKKGNLRYEAVQYAKNIVNKQNADINFPQLKKNNKKSEHLALVKFLGDEIEWIKGSNIKSRNEYFKATRSGRGTDIKVTQQHRQTIYDVLEKYNELLRRHHKYQGVDNEDLAQILVEKAEQIPDEFIQDHILVDEAQDLFTSQLKAIRTFTRKSLTIGADMGQQIYRRTFTWKQAGIDVAGTRSRLLDQTFRSTKQIIRLANNFQEQNKEYLKDKNFIKAKEPNIEGKKPELMFCPDKHAEEEQLLKRVQKIRSSFPDDTIGIIATTHKRLDAFHDLLENKGVPVYKIKDESVDFISPGAKLITYPSSKGLEFDHVIITELKERKLPHNPGPGEDEIEYLTRERKKLYVALTRAKKTLFLIATKKYSSFIDELDTDLYELVRE